MSKTITDMKWLITLAVRLLRAVDQISTRKWSFLGVFALAFLSSVVALGRLDLLPEAPATVAAPEKTVVTIVSEPKPVAELPTRVEIKKINLSTPITNPTVTDIPTLDKALLQGAVRYPTSAKLGESGNVVLFGHSSYLPVVANQAYKAFNGIQKLVAGDVITVYSLDTVYSYRVRNVLKESTNGGAIPLKVDGRVLTLSTCDSFGATSDRFVVTADFVESHPAGS